MKTIFIWDIHGCYDEFMLLIKKLEIQKKDKVYLVWDMISKWPKSYKTLKFLYKNKKQYKCIQWNNELNLVRFFAWNSEWRSPEGIKDLEKNLKIFKKKKATHLIDYLENLPLYIEKNNFIMIHGGLIPKKSLSSHAPDEITRLREYKWEPWHSYYDWDKPIIYWHWAVQWLHTTHNTIWLDSWCVYGKELTAYILETWEFITQKALKPHVAIWKTKVQRLLYRIKWQLNLIK